MKNDSKIQIASNNEKKGQKGLNNLIKRFNDKKNASMVEKLSDIKSSIHIELMQLNPKRLKRNSIIMSDIKDYDDFKVKIKQTRGIELDKVTQKHRLSISPRIDFRL